MRACVSFVALGSRCPRCHARDVEEVIKQLSNFGVAGLAIAALIYVVRHQETKLAKRDERQEARDEKHRLELEAFHQRLERKSDNYAEHLIALQKEVLAACDRANENSARVSTLAEALMRKIRPRGGDDE